MSVALVTEIVERGDADRPSVDAGQYRAGPVAVRDAIRAISRQRPVVLLDDISDPPRGPIGALFMAAQHVDTERMALLVRETSGFVCVAMRGDRLDKLRLPLLAPTAGRTALGFAVAVDLRSGLTTGISARDRAMTARALADPSTQPDDLARPGHVLPVCAADAGVLGQPGLAEATVDVCRAAGLAPVAALATVLDSVGEVADAAELAAVADRLGIPLVRVSEVVTYFSTTTIDARGNYEGRQG
jgi:3,4-dihydroxy 2-butanone 4-phosphate synthase / GTP cyclohydrolase II